MGDYLLEPQLELSEPLPTSSRLRRSDSSPRWSESRWLLVFLVTGLLLGLAMRVWIYSTPLGQIDGDEAVGVGRAV